MQEMTAREFGLDWLRIGAFASLILYHIGMFFVPWDWHVKSRVEIDWIEWPMSAVNPWRLLLLFIISGFVSRLMLGRIASPLAFARGRSWRLLLPLGCGVLLIVPPQAWAELRAAGSYQGSYLHFLAHDYMEFGSSRGLALPTWNHLWFVAYLWVYTALLSALAALPRRWLTFSQNAFDSLFAKSRIFLLPVLWLFIVRWLVYPRFGQTHALVDDVFSHAIYVPAFLLGAGLARSPRLMEWIERNWRGSAALAALAALLLEMVTATRPDAASAVLWSILAWSAIIGLIGLARTKLNFDHPARQYLTRAVFPFYILHQTIIVLAGLWTIEQDITGSPAFALLLGSTFIGCAAGYELVRRVNWLGPPFGLTAVNPHGTHRDTS